MDVKVWLWRKLSTGELMLLNCGVQKKTLESPLDSKEIQSVHDKGNQSWIFTGRTDAETETPVLWPPDENWLIWKCWCWCWERLKVEEGDDRGWGGWMASLTQWTWVWVNSRRWWWTGRPGMLQSMGLQRVRTDWVIEQQQMKVTIKNLGKYFPF